MKSVLFLVAMEEEALPLIKFFSLQRINEEFFQGVFGKSTIDLAITGIGMTNVAKKMVSVFYNNHIYDEIYNIGYAGSASLKQGIWVSVDRVFQHDFDLSACGIDYHMDPSGLEDYKICSEETLPTVPCYTGSHFVTTKLASSDYVVDMEAYMVATLSSAFLKPKLHIFKLVSDGSNSEEFLNGKDSLMEAKLPELTPILTKYLNEN